MLPGEFDPTRMTALVLDDRHYERGITLDQLRALGLNRVVGAPNAHEAWELLCRVNPDIVFLEWLQGDGDGLDFVRRVRAGGEAPNRAVAIFMLTARSARADVEAARQAGVDGYLRKPIAALAVERRVRKVVGNPQPFIMTETYVGPCRRRVREGYVHAGPWRRLDDVAPDQSADEDLFDVKAELARARVAQVEASARMLTAGDGKSARRVYKATQGLVEVAEQIGDKNLELGARELMRYLQAQGATERLDPNAVRIHISALHQLVHLPQALGLERDRVAESLRRMVDKKLRSATNAA